MADALNKILPVFDPYEKAKRQLVLQSIEMNKLKIAAEKERNPLLTEYTKEKLKGFKQQHDRIDQTQKIETGGQKSINDILLERQSSKINNSEPLPKEEPMKTSMNIQPDNMEQGAFGQFATLDNNKLDNLGGFI